MKSKGIIATIIASASLLFGCGAKEIRTSTVDATVVSKTFVGSYSIVIMQKVGNIDVPITQFFDEENRVEIQYMDTKTIIDNKKLFDSVQEGQVIPATLEQGFNGEGDLVYSKLIIDE